MKRESVRNSKTRIEMPLLSVRETGVLTRIGAKEILVELKRGPRRYKDFFKLTNNGKRVFETTTTLANRLRELAVLRLIEKHVENKVGERIRSWYEITDAGKEVLYHLLEIDKILSSSKIQG